MRTRRRRLCLFVWVKLKVETQTTKRLLIHRAITTKRRKGFNQSARARFLERIKFKNAPAAGPIRQLFWIWLLDVKHYGGCLFNTMS